MFDKPYTINAMNSYLQWFVSETRRIDRIPYPPKILYQILCSSLRYSRECQSDPPNFLNRKDFQFKNLHGTCNIVIYSLCEQGVQEICKDTNTKADGDKLWELGILLYGLFVHEKPAQC